MMMAKYYKLIYLQSNLMHLIIVHILVNEFIILSPNIYAIHTHLIHYYFTSLQYTYVK